MEVIIFILVVGAICGFGALISRKNGNYLCNRNDSVKIHTSMGDPSRAVIWRGFKEISFEYKKVGEEAEGRSILLSEISYDNDGRIFLCGMCHMRNEERNFLVDRITSNIIESTSKRKFAKFEFIQQLCSGITNIEITEVQATSRQREIDDIALRKVVIKRVGDISSEDKKFALRSLIQLYDSDASIQKAAREEGGVYLARIFKNVLTNSFGTDSRDTYRESLLALESSHKIARLLRSESFRHMTSSALDIVPEFMKRGGMSENAVFFNEVVRHWSAQKRKVVKISVLKRFLRESGG